MTTEPRNFVGNGNPEGIGLRALLAEDLRAHGNEFRRPGFRALLVHRLGNARMSVQPRVLRSPLSVLYRMMFRRVRNRYGIELEYSTKVGRRVVIDHQNGIVISGYCRIGDDCRIRQNVTMGIRSAADPHGAPTLGDRVDIGAGAVLLGPITIGDDAIIGANAVVLSDVPAGALAVGVPARIVSREPQTTAENKPAI